MTFENNTELLFKEASLILHQIIALDSGGQAIKKHRSLAAEHVFSSGDKLTRLGLISIVYRNPW